MQSKDLKKYLEPSLYRILCLDLSATQIQIKENFRGLCKTEHPDVSKESKDIAHEKFLMINNAYQILSNETFKAEYDKILSQHILLKNEENRKKQEEKNKINFTAAKRPITNSKPVKEMTEFEFKMHAWETLAKSLDKLLKQMEVNRK